MEATLLENFRVYLVNNNPELVLMNVERYSLSRYISDKMEQVRPLMKRLLEEGHPGYLVSLICHSKLIEGLRPSKANYIKEILESDFPTENFRMKEYGVLTYGVVNLIELCEPLFQAYSFNEENLLSQLLRCDVVSVVHDYLVRRG